MHWVWRLGVYWSLTKLHTFLNQKELNWSELVTNLESVTNY